MVGDDWLDEGSEDNNDLTHQKSEERRVDQEDRKDLDHS